MITLRLVAAGTDAGLGRLAELSGSERPAGVALVAEVNGEPRAALAGARIFSDPFFPASELESLLALRQAQLEAARRPGAAA